MCRALLRFPHLSFIPPVPYPPLRGTFPLRGRLCIGDSDSLANGALETIFPDLFHTASPIQPPPLRGTSFHRKEGASTRAPFLGRGCRAKRGGIGFLFGRRSRLLFAFPIGERGPRSGTLVNGVLETISHSLSYRFPHPTSAPSGHLPLEGKALSDALVYDALETIFSLSFIPLVPYPASFARHLPHAGKALSVVILFSTYACIRSDNTRKAAFSYRSLPPWGRGTAQRWIGCSRKRRT